MTALAPALQAFFTDRLGHQRNASPHTVAAYRDTFRLLLAFVTARTGKPASRLDICDLDAATITSFLTHLEHDRGNTARTRNARLAAIHAFFTYAAPGHPEHAGLIARVLAIPAKRHQQADITFLDAQEAEALLNAPDQRTWLGRRDRALILVTLQCGLRVSELTAMSCSDVHLGTGAHVRCHGKGRKDRLTPLTPATVSMLASWLTERNGNPADPLFPTASGHPLSRDAVAKLLAKHHQRAAERCPSLAGKTVTPHILRHTAVICTAFSA
jgi:integrase/recombinase XerD